MKNLKEIQEFDTLMDTVTLIDKTMTNEQIMQLKALRESILNGYKVKDNIDND